jgi:hypothetical protein
MTFGTALWISGAAMVPDWHALPSELRGLWAWTLCMLFMPRVLGLAAVLLQRRQGGYGGTLALLGSAVAETVLAAATADRYKASKLQSMRWCDPWMDVYAFGYCRHGRCRADPSIESSRLMLRSQWPALSSTLSLVLAILPCVGAGAFRGTPSHVQEQSYAAHLAHSLRQKKKQHHQEKRMNSKF